MKPAAQGIINFHNGKPYDLIDKAEGTNHINFTYVNNKPEYENHILVRIERESFSNDSKELIDLLTLNDFITMYVNGDNLISFENGDDRINFHLGKFVNDKFVYSFELLKDDKQFSITLSYDLIP
jgi:hypothetical protein